MPPLLNIFASVRSIPFCPLLCPSLHEMFLWYLWFSSRDLYSFPFYCFSSISLHWLLRKAFLSLLAILWNSAFKWVYLSFSPLFFSQLFVRPPQATILHFCISFFFFFFFFLHFFFLGMVLITASCTMSRTSIHSSPGTLSVRSNPLSLSVTSTV